MELKTDFIDFLKNCSSQTKYACVTKYVSSEKCVFHWSAAIDFYPVSAGISLDATMLHHLFTHLFGDVKRTWLSSGL